MQRIILTGLLISFLGALSLAGGCKDNAEKTTPQQILAEFAIPQKHGTIFLPVKFKGKEYTFLLDTGCGITTFDISLRELLGEQKGTAEAVNYAGKALVCQVFDAPEAFVGPLNILDCGQTHCLDLEVFRSHLRRPFDGIIGVNFLKKYVVQLDFDNGKLLFLNPAETPDPNWGTGLDLTYFKGAPQITGTILNDIKVSFLVDTACAKYNAVRSEVFKEVLRKDPNAVFEGTQELSDNVTKEKRVARLSNVAIGPFEYQNMVFIED